MAIIKCKMCGGDLNIVEGSSVAECEYCGTKQTVPSADNEKKLTLFGRAGRLLRACEFDKAAGVYESIVADFPEEAEAYWGLVLCKYGIEYVDDPATGKKIPTCHRSSFDSVLDDENFDQACENADSVARRLYREEAKGIEELRKRIIEVSGKEAPYDIFICYKETGEDGERTLDSVLAQDIYDALTEKGYRVFFSRVTLEDKLGQEYEPYIFAALNSAKVMLAVGTDYDHYNAVWVKNEWSRFLQLISSGQKKTLIPCYKNIDAYDMPKEFAKLQAQDLGKVGAMQDLLRGVDKILGRSQQAAQAQAASSGPNVDSLLKRGQIFLGDGDWSKADEYFDKALDIDPENARAYFGKLLAARKAKDKAALAVQAQEIEGDPLFQKALRYADESHKAELQNLRASVQEAINSAAQEKEAGRLENIQRLKPLIERSAAARKCIAAGYRYIVGVKVDGTVVAVGENNKGQCNVSEWTDIVAAAAGEGYTVGLKSDGTAVAVGEIAYCMCSVNVSGWTNIAAIAASTYHTVGLKSDGTVVADEGNNDSYRYSVKDWTDIVAVSAGEDYTVGLKSDGTVVVAGKHERGECNVSDWKDIVAVAAGIIGYSDCTVGLKSDGTVLVTEKNYDKVSDWKLFNSIDTLEEEVREARRAAEEQRRQEEEARKLAEEQRRREEEARRAAEEQRRKERIEALNKEAESLKAELSNLRGLFSGKRRKEIEARLDNINWELNQRS